VGGLTLLALALTSGSAHAQKSFIPSGSNAAFAADGQFVITSELNFRLHKPSGGTWTLLLQPSLDYFIAQHISIGGLVYLEAGDGWGNFGLGPRAGYAFNLGERVSFWPTVMIKAIKYSGQDVKTELWLQGPFLFHLVPHFFIGAGPYVEADMSNGSGSDIGLYATIGGYF